MSAVSYSLMEQPPYPAPAPALPAVLDVAALSIDYGAQAVVHDVSLQIPERQVTAIMGPSGCGKSTLVKALNRSLELTPGVSVRGTVRFRGRDIYDGRVDPRGVRKRIGIILQRPVPFPMSIEENLLFGVRFHERLDRRARRELVEHYLRQVGLWDEVGGRLHGSALALSGGQQQRLCLARTLANRPEVLLMDEPCSSLDPASTARIEDLIRTLKRDYTVVIVTHNLAQARRIGDRAVLMLDGRVVEAGAAEALFSAPCTSAARDFIEGRTG